MSDDIKSEETFHLGEETESFHLGGGKAEESFHLGGDNEEESFHLGGDNEEESFHLGGDNEEESFHLGGDIEEESFHLGGDNEEESFHLGGDNEEESFHLGGDMEEFNISGNISEDDGGSIDYTISEDGNSIIIDADDAAMDVVQDFVRDKLLAYGCENKVMMQIRLAVEEIFVNIISLRIQT